MDNSLRQIQPFSLLIQHYTSSYYNTDMYIHMYVHGYSINTVDINVSLSLL